MAGRIEIKKIGITKLDVDCIVNTANAQLQHGGGVCGAIFAEAGQYELQHACDQYGGCPTGKAVITPGFRLKAKYVIHAVGPVWCDGKSGEEELLRSCYQESLKLAMKYDCRSIAFPLISSGIYGYPKECAWRVAIAAIHDFLSANTSYQLDVTMAVIDEEMYQMGKALLKEGEKQANDFVFFWHEDEKNGCFSQWYSAGFEVEGIRYQHAEQYMMAKKALLFGDLEYYTLIMHEANPKICKDLGKRVRGFDTALWDKYKEEIVYRANLEKFGQNRMLKKELLATEDAILAEASPYDKVWGIGLKAEDTRSRDPKKWNGNNLLGKVLMKVRNELRNKQTIRRNSRFTDPDLYTEARSEERRILAEKRARGIALHELKKEKWEDLNEKELGLALQIMSDVKSSMSFCKTSDGEYIDFERIDIENGIIIDYE